MKTLVIKKTPWTNDAFINAEYCQEVVEVATYGAEQDEGKITLHMLIFAVHLHNL